MKLISQITLIFVFLTCWGLSAPGGRLPELHMQSGLSGAGSICTKASMEEVRMKKLLAPRSRNLEIIKY